MKRRFGRFRDAKMTQVSIYVIITVVVSFILIHLVRHIDSILIAIGNGLHWLGVIFVPLAGGFAIAYLLYPLVRMLEKRFDLLPYYRKRKKGSRALAVAVTMLIAAAVIVAIFSIVISAVTREARLIQASDITYFLKSLAVNISNLYDSFSEWLGELNISSSDISNMIDNITNAGSKYVQNLASGIVGSISSIPRVFANVLFAIIFGIYFLLDSKGLTNYWDRVLKAVTGDKAYGYFHRFLDDADRAFSGYIRGQLLDAIIMANLVGVVLYVLNVKFAVIIGLLVGIGNLIPYVGPFVAYISTALVCIINGDLKKLIIAIIVLFVVQTIDGNIINPKLLSKSISVHPLLVIAALIIGSAIGGIMGMLLAVPVAALLKIQFDRLIEYLLHKKETSAAGMNNGETGNATENGGDTVYENADIKKKKTVFEEKNDLKRETVFEEEDVLNRKTKPEETDGSKR